MLRLAARRGSSGTTTIVMPRRPNDIRRSDGRRTCAASAPSRPRSARRPNPARRLIPSSQESTIRQATAASIVASVTSHVLAVGASAVSWASRTGQSGSRSVWCCSTQPRHGVTPGTTSGPTTPPPSRIVTGRWVRPARLSRSRRTGSTTESGVSTVTVGGSLGSACTPDAVRRAAMTAASPRGRPSSARPAPAGPRSRARRGRGSSEIDPSDAGSGQQAHDRAAHPAGPLHGDGGPAPAVQDGFRAPRSWVGERQGGQVGRQPLLVDRVEPSPCGCRRRRRRGRRARPGARAGRGRCAGQGLEPLPAGGRRARSAVPSRSCRNAATSGVTPRSTTARPGSTPSWSVDASRQSRRRAGLTCGCLP